MGLSNYRPVAKKIEIGDGESFLVKGLSVSDLNVLVQQYYPDLVVIAEQFTAIGVNVWESGNVNAFLLDAIRLAPHIVGTVIAIGNQEDEPTDFAHVERMARLLPFPVQTEALQAIMELTFREVGGPKKFVATLSKLIAGMMPPGTAEAMRVSLGHLKTNLTGSAGESEAK